MVFTSRNTSAACGTESGAPWPSITSSAEPSAQYSSTSQRTGSAPSGPRRRK